MAKTGFLGHGGLILAAVLGICGAALAGDSAPRHAYFGELHVHSSNSFDSYFSAVRVGPEQAYRFGRGESVLHYSGEMVRANAALDFMAVTDHARYLGVFARMDDPAHPLFGLEIAEDLRSSDWETRFAAFLRVLYPAEGEEPAIPKNLADAVMRETWQEYVTLAEKYYQPGKFTTFVGYEWTAAIGNAGLHRNIIFRGLDVPAMPLSSIETNDPEDLWDWMDRVRGEGSDLLAIPHNSNLSDGLMFRLRKADGGPIDDDWIRQRSRNEPLAEITQVKGTSETHPVLSPTDEWAGFEILDELMGADGAKGELHGSYLRETYLAGLRLGAKRGINPFKLGLIGSTDGHNAVSPNEEDNYTGKMGNIDGTIELRRTGGSGIARHNYMLSASGLAGVWAEENTREAIFDALKRKETFATSGPRIKLRFFGGWDFDHDLTGQAGWEQAAYKAGVAMGGDLPPAPRSAGAPLFAVRATKDASSAWLQRVQIIKGWIDGEETHERVYDVACSDGLVPDPATHRCPDNGAMVDIKTCDISKNAGDVSIGAVWRDPDFAPDQHAFYYARVLENPTCRWSTWEANRLGLAPLEGPPSTIQERAWSSPIWYNP